MAQEDVFKKLVSHCKEYGFVFPSSEIYDGLGAVYDYAQMGVELKNNIKQYWWQSMVLLHENIVGIDSAIFMHPTIWKASGHVDAFNDPLIDNKDSKKRYRADVLIEDQLAKYDEKINKEVAKAAKRFGESFDEAQFIIARTWKQPRCPSADEWIRKLWYIYTMEYYSATSMRWMKLELIIQSEVSQKEKHQYSILMNIYGI